jgi:lysyl-tRNA synthetase, class II
VEEDNKLIEERREKLKALRASGNAYPNDFRPKDAAASLQHSLSAKTKEELERLKPAARVAGRMVLKRVMGKASFATLQDGSGRIQIYVSNDATGENVHESFKHWDLGDIVGVEGQLFRTMKGELTVQAASIRLLAKALRPLPEKFHGLTDHESRYRQRYVDLIVNPHVREIFQKRSEVVQGLREVLRAEGYLEVETPMMQPIPGGAAARPFKTHHNALDMELYLRIAPELYLKRLVVGGVERVFEINRNFRNEGISTRHNPEFTMLELYVAYADYRDLIVMVERAMQGLADVIHGSRKFDYQGRTYDLDQPFTRLTVLEAVAANTPGFDVSRARDVAYLRELCTAAGIKFRSSDGAGKLQIGLFEMYAEHTFMDPTFVYAYPTEVSPLSRANDADPFLTDRFEFFVAGRELANGFSELNDAEDQAARFRAQVERKDAGDDEAMYYDADYVRALEYGMPPTAGLGVGIDRLVMFYTDAPSIRDVLLFPHMRPESE